MSIFMGLSVRTHNLLILLPNLTNSIEKLAGRSSKHTHYQTGIDWFGFRGKFTCSTATAAPLKHAQSVLTTQVRMSLASYFDTLLCRTHLPGGGLKSLWVVVADKYSNLCIIYGKNCLLGYPDYRI